MHFPLGLFLYAFSFMSVPVCLVLYVFSLALPSFLSFSLIPFLCASSLKLFRYARSSQQTEKQKEKEPQGQKDKEQQKDT